MSWVKGSKEGQTHEVRALHMSLMVYKFSRVVDMLIAHLAHVGTASDFVSVTSSRWKSDA